jgi:hydroxymethylglutaryl-CoA lyase
MLASMGIDTGIDLGRLLELRERVAGWLEGEATHGTVWRAGLPKTMKGARPRAPRPETKAQLQGVARRLKME